MQKLVKKNSDKRLVNKTVAYVAKDNSKKPRLNSKQKLKYPKFNKAKEKRLKTLRLIKRTIFGLVSGRPHKKYKLGRKTKFLRLTVRIAPNNMFCHIKDTKTNTVLRSVSSGSYKMKVSKKGIRNYSKLIANAFLKDLRDKQIKFNKPLVAKIIAPVGIRKPLLTIFKNSLFKKFNQKRKLLLEVASKKVFNGCRPRKKVRKKRKGLRLFK
jgi:ribosomal protein L18